MQGKPSPSRTLRRHPPRDVKAVPGGRNMVMLGGCLPLVRVDRLAQEFNLQPPVMLDTLTAWEVPIVRTAANEAYVHLGECIRQLFRLTCVPTAGLVDSEVPRDDKGHPLWTDAELDARVFWYMSCLPMTRRKQILSALEDLPSFTRDGLPRGLGQAHVASRSLRRRPPNATKVSEAVRSHLRNTHGLRYTADDEGVCSSSASESSTGD